MKAEEPLVRGVSNPAIIDLITTEPGHHGVTLVMIERRTWSGGRKQLEELDAKLNSYFTYVLDGHLESQYPQYAGLPIRLRLDCVEEPPAEVRGMLREASRIAAEQALHFAIRVVSEAAIPRAPWEQEQEGVTRPVPNAEATQSAQSVQAATPPPSAPPFRYAADVLAALDHFGIRPSSRIPPQKVRELLQALYVFEIREFRLKQKEIERFFGPQPHDSQAAHVRALKARYPLLSLPLERWSQGLGTK